MTEKKPKNPTKTDTFVITALISKEVPQSEIGPFTERIGKVGKIEKVYIMNLNDYEFEEKIIEAIKKVDTADE